MIKIFLDSLIVDLFLLFRRKLPPSLLFRCFATFLKSLGNLDAASGFRVIRENSIYFHRPRPNVCARSPSIHRWPSLTQKFKYPVNPSVVREPSLVSPTARSLIPRNVLRYTRKVTIIPRGRRLTMTIASSPEAVNYQRCYRRARFALSFQLTGELRRASYLPVKPRRDPTFVPRNSELITVANKKNSFT